MRMRFKPYAAAELAACEYHINNPQAYKGRWSSLFVRPSQPLHMELGCGKGGFLSQLASAHPNRNYIGIDITDKVLILAKRNIERQYAQLDKCPDNVVILSHDIERIRCMLAPPDCIERIYINFCNPWNKKSGQTKHRLTHPRQLVQYRTFLSEHAEICFKCDDENLFEDTISYLPQAGFEVEWITRNLHQNEPSWNIRTEHEQMFAKIGISIKALRARKIALSDQQMNKWLAQTQQSCPNGEFKQFLSHYTTS